MSLITRYVLIDFVRVFVVTIVIMTPILLFSLLGFELQNQGVSPGVFLNIIPYILPSALYICIPAATLFASVTVFGRLSRENELTAIKSIGVSPIVIIWPTLVLATGLSVLTLWLNDVSVSWGRAGVYRVVLASMERTVLGMLKSKGKFDNDRISIFVEAVEGNRLIRPRLVVNTGKDSPILTLSAESAIFRTDPAEEKLSLVMENGSLDRDGKIHFRFEDRQTWDFSLGDLTRKSREQGKPSDLPLSRIQIELENQILATQVQREQNAVTAMIQLTSGSFPEMTEPQWRVRNQKLDLMTKRIFRLETEPWRRWANGFSCLGFAILGIPLSIWMKNSDMWTSFGLCFVPTLAVYVPLMLFGVDRAKNGSAHPSIVWLGNLVILLIGILLFRRALRH